jgi:hypothetical protein
MQFRFSRRAEGDSGLHRAGQSRTRRDIRATAARTLPRTGRIPRPEARRLRSELGKGVRLSVLGNYVVHEDILEIRRVVHGARDLADIDSGTSDPSLVLWDARAVTLDENV